jgi:NAD-dependent dihydropyrimidine dehydrogenase PreA subunit
MRIVIDSSKRRGSGECVKVCPEQALSLVDGGAVLDRSLCNLDGLCIPACPYDAIRYDEGEVGGA